MELFSFLDIAPVVCLYRGTYNREVIENMFHNVVNDGEEGIVIRNVEPFWYNDFSKNIAKCVRKDHVQTGTHWKNSKIEKKLHETFYK